MKKLIFPTMKKSSHENMEVDGLLDILGDYFVKERLQAKGWEFIEFVQAFKEGYIQLEIK